MADAQTKAHCVTYGATMYYRDLTRAAPMVQREIDLVHTAATGDALTVYLWWMTRDPHRPTRNTFADCRHASLSVAEDLPGRFAGK